MAKVAKTIEVYLEKGMKRVFAGAIDWPGWCRSGRDEASALEALRAYGPRYARVFRGAKLGFTPPTEVSAFRVVERLRGDTTTDFGSPSREPSADRRPVSAADLRRFEAFLKACWRAYDAAEAAARGKPLRKGPRGGGRDLEKITEHVAGADGGYLARIAWKLKAAEGSAGTELRRARRAIVGALDAAVHEGVPARGPRGGIMWSPRYFVRRVAWHVLDHAWEIEDRTL
jgi:hypothetical protein